MTLRTVGGRRTAESVEDLKTWLRELDGCPPITRSVVARCRLPVHGSDSATWFYVEADAEAGVARLRCLACGDARPVLDSAERWTYPRLWSCLNCNQSIAEVAYGVHDDDGQASWLVVGVRCVECGSLSGATDLVVSGDVDEIVTAL